jgi:REP element-mobilizing transposase RayT
MNENFYRRNLPHFHPNDAPYFVTTRLADSMPIEVLRRMKFERDEELARIAEESGDPNAALELRRQAHNRYFGKYDKFLDLASTGPLWMKDTRIAEVVHSEILALDGEQYTLWASTIMSNHIHPLYSLLPESKELYDVMKLIKGRSAIKSNHILERRGSFWQDESYDHVVREREFARIVTYIINNPVNAGLVKHWRDWPYTYLHPSFEGF